MKNKILRSFTDVEYQRELSEIFRHIFGVNIQNTTNIPIPQFDKRALLCPVSPGLSEAFLQAVSNAILNIGDDGFYISLLLQPIDSTTPNHWFIPIESLNSYFSLDPSFKVLPNAIYSPNKRWGISISPDLYAIAGGSQSFINTLFKHLPNSIEEHAKEFIADLKYNKEKHAISIAWLPDFLSLIYGKAKAQEFILDAKL